MSFNYWKYLMRHICLSILFILLWSSALNADAQNPVPIPESTHFPNIRASLDDGFFVLAEQQARGVMRNQPKEEEAREAVLLLAHALWGQKRYAEMLDLLKGYAGEPGIVYWRARALFEQRSYDAALAELDKGAQALAESRYAPAALRLTGHLQQLIGKLEEAEASFRKFAERFPEHADRVANQFNLADVLSARKKIPEAIAVYETLANESDPETAHRAQLLLAHVLYTQGAAENFDTARGLLHTLGTNEQVRLAFRIDAFVDLAALEEAAGKTEASIAALRRAIALSPDANQRVPLKMSLARMLTDRDDADGALKLLEECRTEAPNEALAAELQLQKAGVLLQAKRFADADAAYQVYLDVADDPAGLAKAYFGKGLALWSMEPGRFAEAAVAFDKAVAGLKDDKTRAEALFKAGDACYKAGKFDEAGKRYRRFAMEYSTSPLVPNAFYQTGLALARAGDRPEALQVFQSLEEVYPESEFAEKAALRAADILWASRKWEEVLAKYTLISQTYTNSPATQALSEHQRGLALYRLGQYSDAQKAFDHVLAAYPDSEYVVQATYLRGFCLAFQGKTEEGVKTCESFVEKYPDSEWTPEVIFWLAEHHFNRGDYEKAEPLFLRVASEFKTHRLAPRALYWAGRCSAARSNYVQAIERYSEIAKNYPDNEFLPQVRFRQGDALTELGEFARAILAFEEIIKNYPDNPLVNAAWGRKGDCQFTLGTDNPARYAEAMSSYQAILDRPSAPVALKLQAGYKLGRCLEKTNAPDKAFGRYMNDVVYLFINGNVEHSPESVMWFTRAAWAAAQLKEKEKAWQDAVKVYQRVVEANVPAGDDAAKRILEIKAEHWLEFQ